MAAVFPAGQAIVVGGGLAGMSAANTVLENGGKVVVLDKSSFCGGNSTKATSGINGAATKTQKAQGIADSIDLFTSDTLKGGAKKPDVVKVLCGNSGDDVDWLMEKFNLDLSLVARLGGHSAPRTHRGKERFPGMTITYALIQMVEKIAERTDRARIITKARAVKLLTNGGACVGLIYEKGGAEFQEHGPVILATGGFGADFTQQSLLAQYRPDLMHLPTTNGEHCTGDGIKMGEAIGGKSIDLEWVQVHPTGLVKPDDPDAKIKFLAAEALRGVGGLVLNAAGERFCNELGRRDYVTGEMWKNKPPFRLVLNKAASDEIIWHCKHYTGRGVMKFYPTGEDLAKDMGIPLSRLVETHDQHFAAAEKQAKDPDGGSFPAYPSGKTWDEVSGKTGAGKKFFHNIIPGSKVASEPFYVAIITPVIHYCMGGLEIDVNSAVLGSNGKAIAGLYAAGEVAGGVHGNNRLGGNSLLDCVVFGRVAGRHAAKYMLGDAAKETSLKDLSGGGLSGAVEASKLSGGSYEDGMNKAEGGAKAGAPAKAKKEKKAASGGGYTMEDVAKHTTKSDCWVVLHGRVLDVTSFLSSHPGGELAILTFAGKDATAEFDMIHPPDVIEKYAPEAVIGVLGGGGGDEDDDDDDDDDDDEEEDDEEAGDAPAGSYTVEDVAKHTTKSDCWVILHGRVLDVTSFLSQHPGGELAILTFAGKDATAEFDMIHPPDVVEKYAPEAVIGVVGSGKAVKAKKEKSGGAVAAGGKAAYTVADVAKHTTKSDCWVILHGRVLDVTSFLSQHPGGELAILTFAGKDATAEFDMIHPPDVIEKYAPDSIIGVVGSSSSTGGKAKKSKKGAAAPVSKDKGSALANHQAWGHLEGTDNWRIDGLDNNPGVFLVNVKAYFDAAWFLLLSVLWEVCATIFTSKNLKISGDRTGLTRSAILLVLFIVIHAVGNLHVFKGPDDFNGYGYFYVRLYWTGFGLPANIVEEYILLAVLLHVFVGLKRTWDKMGMVMKSPLLQKFEQLQLAMTGLVLLTFMTIHLFQFRFGDTDQFGPYFIRPPPYLINFWGILSLNLFWTDDASVAPVGVRDIYALEFQIFQSRKWCGFYIAAVVFFMIHACLGWKKVTPVLGIPKGHYRKVEWLGYIIFLVLGLIYISFPVYVQMTKPFAGYETGIQVPADRLGA